MNCCTGRQGVQFFGFFNWICMIVVCSFIGLLPSSLSKYTDRYRFEIFIVQDQSSASFHLGSEISHHLLAIPNIVDGNVQLFLSGWTPGSCSTTNSTEGHADICFTSYSESFELITQFPKRVEAFHPFQNALTSQFPINEASIYALTMINETLFDVNVRDNQKTIRIILLITLSPPMPQDESSLDVSVIKSTIQDFKQLNAHVVVVAPGYFKRVYDVWRHRSFFGRYLAYYSPLTYQTDAFKSALEDNDAFKLNLRRIFNSIIGVQ